MYKMLTYVFIYVNDMLTYATSYAVHLCTSNSMFTYVFTCANIICVHYDDINICEHIQFKCIQYVDI